MSANANFNRPKNEKDMKQYDIFISHANADKLEFVENLKKSFDKLGISIFYDKDSIGWGDDWKDRIRNGLKNCRFAVVIISENFFDREWTEKELKELLSRQKSSGRKLILPIIHKISADMLCEKYKELSDIQFLDSSKLSVEDITFKLAQILLKEQKREEVTLNNNNETIPNNNQIFNALFEKMNTIDFFRWVDKLIQNNNQWIGDFDKDYIGWHNIKINGKYINLIQQYKKQYDSNYDMPWWYKCESSYQYRINPIYFDDFCKYFDQNIRPQM